MQKDAVTKENRQLTECPQCHQQIEIEIAHHGTLFTCPMCSAVYFVGWDGKPETPVPEIENEFSANDIYGNSSESNQSIQTDIAFADFSDAEQIVPDNSDYNPTSYESLPENSDLGVLSSDETPVGMSLDSQEILDDYSSTAEIEAVGEVSFTTPEVDSVDSEYDFSKPLDEVSLQNMQEPVSDSANFEDIQNFANSDTSQGGLSYSLLIEGIDSGKIHKDLRDALTDNRLGIDLDALLKQVNAGSLRITGLNPVKASVIINRVKYLPLKLSWRQDVLSSI